MQTSAEFLPSAKYIILPEKKLEIFWANILLSILIVLFSMRCFELNSKYSVETKLDEMGTRVVTIRK